MKTAEQIARELAADWGTDGATRDQDYRLALAAIMADRAQRKPVLHGLGVNDYEVEPEGDLSGAWVNIVLWERELDGNGERVPLGSLLLSSVEARDLQHELRDARREAEAAYIEAEEAL